MKIDFNYCLTNKLTSRGYVILKKLTVAQPIKESPSFMDNENSHSVQNTPQVNPF
jgi:hypothetical protein